MALHATAVVPGRLYGDTTACDLVGFRKAQTVFDLPSVHQVPVDVQSQVLLIISNQPLPLVLGRKSLQSNVLVPLILSRLSHVLEKLAAFVQNEK